MNEFLEKLRSLYPDVSILFNKGEFDVWVRSFSELTKEEVDICQVRVYVKGGEFFTKFIHYDVLGLPIIETSALTLTEAFQLIKEQLETENAKLILETLELS